MGSNAGGMTSGNNIKVLMDNLRFMQAGVPMENAFAPRRPPVVELPPDMFAPPQPGQPQQVAPPPQQQPQPPIKSVLRR